MKPELLKTLERALACYQRNIDFSTEDKTATSIDEIDEALQSELLNVSKLKKEFNIEL